MDLNATQQNGENLGSGAEQYSMFSNDNPKKPKNFFQKHAMVFLIGAVVAVVVTAAVLFISVTYNKSVTKNSNQQNSSDEQNKDGGNSKPNEEVIVTKGSNNNTITIASSNMTLKVGETGELAVVLTPLNMPNNSYSISIADPSIISASVNKENNNVSITAKKYGTTSITLTLQDGGASAKTDVRVVSPDTVIYYRYRDKSTTTAKVPTLPGWTFDYKEETWGDWGAWSDWSQTQPTAKEARDIEWKQTTTATG